MYDYLIVGASLEQSSHTVTKRSKKVKVIDKRDHIGRISIVKKLKESMF